MAAQRTGAQDEAQSGRLPVIRISPMVLPEEIRHAIWRHLGEFGDVVRTSLVCHAFRDDVAASGHAPKMRVIQLLKRFQQWSAWVESKRLLPGPQFVVECLRIKSLSDLEEVFSSSTASQLQENVEHELAAMEAGSAGVAGPSPTTSLERAVGGLAELDFSQQSAEWQAIALRFLALSVEADCEGRESRGRALDMALSRFRQVPPLPARHGRYFVRTLSYETDAEQLAQLLELALSHALKQANRGERGRLLATSLWPLNLNREKLSDAAKRSLFASFIQAAAQPGCAAELSADASFVADCENFVGLVEPSELEALADELSGHNADGLRGLAQNAARARRSEAPLDGHQAA